MTTENPIATPPNMAVGCLCQRSILGLATTPNLRANILTTGVRVRAIISEAATASKVRGLNCIFHRDQAAERLADLEAMTREENYSI
jgi:hypothetical protein